MDLQNKDNDYDGQPVLHDFASSSSNESLRSLELLLDRGADINAKDRTGSTPLQLSCQFGRINMFRLLLRRGADTNIKDDSGHTVLHDIVICKYTNYLKIFNLLLDHGANMDIQDDYGRTALHIATTNKLSFHLVKLLVKHGANIDLVDDNGNTPLHNAANGKCDWNVKVVKLLLSRGARVDVRNITGRTAFHKASLSSIADILSRNGADINNRSFTGRTPLHDASSAEASYVVKMLLTRGADVNAQDNSGNTPAHLAKCISKLGYLLGYGAYINMQNSEGLTPLYVACRAGDDNITVVDFLLENHADVNVKTYDGRTILHSVVKQSYFNTSRRICRSLLQYGACVDAKDKEGRTAIECCPHLSNSDPQRETQFELIYHIIKLKSAGFTVKTLYPEIFDDYFKLECLKEFQKIKLTKVNELFSLDIVILNVRNPWYLENLDTMLSLEKKLNSADFLEDFPLYGKILRNTFKKTKHRLNLLKMAFSSFNSGKRKQIWSLSLPDLVKIKILDYLSNDDLVKFSESG